MEIEEALDVLARGGIVAHATETCYGLACDLTNADAVARLFALKKRPLDQPVSALFASVGDAKKYVEWNERAEELARAHLPGPLTMILRVRADAPMKLFPTPGGGDTIGVRVSSHPLAHELAKRFGRPLSTTSANVHGGANPYSAEEVKRQLNIQHSTFNILLLDSGPLPPVPPSTIVNLADPDAKIFRQGSASLD
jgi:L-threonylcarbamoyladenylate synthase